MFDSSHREEFNLAVLHAFVCMQELQDMLIVSALRQFLWSFRLPGEAQKIDRMMEKFAERYCELNPDIFTTTGEDNNLYHFENGSTTAYIYIFFSSSVLEMKCGYFIGFGPKTLTLELN